MPYTPPSVADLTARFPEFDGQDDAIALALTEAARAVDTSWTEGDYQSAIMYYAAHLLASAENVGAGGAAIAAESLGPISVSYRNNASDPTLLKSTAYGVQYARLLRLNQPTIFVI